MIGSLLLEAILQQVWQLGVLFVVVWSLARILGRRWPHLVCLLWIVFFVKCLVPPVIESPIGIMGWLTPDFGASVNMLPFEVVDSAASRASGSQLEPVSNATTVNLEGETVRASTPSGPPIGNLWLVRGFVGLWLVGVFAGLLITALRYRAILFAIRDESRNASLQRQGDLLREDLEKQTARLGWCSGSVKLVVSERFHQPFALGLWRPVIVFPAALLQSVDSSESMLAHEVCHLYRRDPLLGWIQLATQWLFWFYPLVWLASGQLNFWCEVCCDDDAMRIFEIPSTDYAKGLVVALESQKFKPQPLYAPGLSASILTRRRIALILRRTYSGLFRSTYQVAACLLIILLTPAVQSADYRLGISWGAGNQSIEEDALRSLGNLPGILDGPADMNFLVGHWAVFQDAVDGQQLGRSVFHVEPSGKMIRESWLANDGDTAQGITFFDQSRHQWQMTWVDSEGRVSETKGNWNGSILSLNGHVADPEGKRHKVSTRLIRNSDREFRIAIMVDVDGALRPVSKIIYRKQALP